MTSKRWARSGSFLGSPNGMITKHFTRVAQNLPTILSHRRLVAYPSARGGTPTESCRLVRIGVSALQCAGALCAGDATASAPGARPYHRFLLPSAKRGIDRFKEVVELARQRGVPFIAHGADPAPELLESLQDCGIPRLAFVQSADEAERTAQEGAHALVVESGPDLPERLAEIHRRTGLPLLAEAGRDVEQAKSLLEIEGVAGLQLRSPALLHAGAAAEIPGFARLSELPAHVLGEGAPKLPKLKINR